MASFLSTPQSISSIPFLPTVGKGNTSTGNTLSGLTGDVSIISTPSNNQVLTFSTGLGKWTNSASSGGNRLDALTGDVSITESGLSGVKNVLYYDGTTTNKWNAKNLALSDLPSTIVNTGAVGTTNALGAPVVVTTTPTAGQALAYTID